MLNNMLKCYRTYKNNKYNEKLKKHIEFKKTPSIISNNCIGGVICHNLGLKFMTPTINLYMCNKDFLLFVSHLKDFVSAELEEVKENVKKDFPVGNISCSHGTITIYFSHYATFDEAKKKWEERKSRIDWENIVIIMEEGMETSDELIRKFQDLPYERKVLLCNGNIGHIEVKQGFPFFIYDKKYYPGKILRFGKFKISKKRYLDKFDYVEFLNNGKIQEK